MPPRKAVCLQDLRTRIERLSIPEPNSGCWIWIGAGDRYGVITLSDGIRSRSAHTVSYLAHHGTIAPGHVVRHKCDVSYCVNPDHLHLGTHRQNMDDKILRNRCARLAGETNGAAKLSAAQVIAIRLDPRSQRKIAAEYGIFQTLVSRIKRREVWRHL